MTCLRILHRNHSAARHDPPAAGAGGGQVGAVLREHQQGEHQDSKVKISIVVSEVGISALRSELAKKPSLILSTIDTFSDSKVYTC